MNEASRAAAAALQLPDAAYHADTSQPFDAVTRTLAPASGEAGAAEPAAGAPTVPVFALGLPGVVEPMRRQDVPAALAVRFDALRAWEVDLRQNLCVVVVDMRSGELRTAAPFSPTKRLAVRPTPSRTGSPPSGPEARNTLRGVERISLRPVFGDEWPSTTFAVTAIAYDWWSNTRVIERKPAPPPTQPPVIAASPFVETVTGGSAPAPGLSVSVPATAAAGAPIRITASVSADAGSVILADEASPNPRKLMVAHLLLLRLDSPSPVVVSLAVPVGLQQGRAVGSFALDLAKRPEAVGLEGPLQAYLVSGRTVTGPHPLTLKAR